MIGAIRALRRAVPTAHKSTGLSDGRVTPLRVVRAGGSRSHGAQRDRDASGSGSAFASGPGVESDGSTGHAHCGVLFSYAVLISEFSGGVHWGSGMAYAATRASSPMPQKRVL